MAEASVKDQDSYRCSVCLEPLKEPVTIPCGHSYCMSCIGVCWDQEEQKGEYSCPQCRETFSPRPALKKNTMLAELVENLKMGGVQAGLLATPDTVPDVECDFCSEKKAKAVKSCLVCQVSLCETHIQPHNDIPALKKHKLTKAIQLEEMICSQHGSLLQVFCRTDQKCICMLCTMDDHKGHDTVSAAAERKGREGQLRETKQTFQQRIQERENEIQDLREAMKSHNSLAQEAEKHSEKVFTELLDSIERRRLEVKERIRAQQKAAVGHAEGILEELEQEVTQLRRGDAELEQLAHEDNHVHFLQIFRGLEMSLGYKGLPSITLCPQVSFGDLHSSLSAFKKSVEGICQRDVKMMSKNLRKIKIVLPPEPKTREEFLKYSCQLTLDPNTANRYLSLSEQNRKAKNGDGEQQHPDHPDRFKKKRQVLCKEGLSGRSYWEVELSPDGDIYADIAVAYRSIRRKLSHGSDEDEKKDETEEEKTDNRENDDENEGVVEDGDDGADDDEGGDASGTDGADVSAAAVDNDSDDDDDGADVPDADADDDGDDDYDDDDDYIDECEFGHNTQSWSFNLRCEDGSLYHGGKKKKSFEVSSSRLGVYLDHRQGILSFYSISDTMTLLHKVQTTFTEALYPGFGLYNNTFVTLCL